MIYIHTFTNILVNKFVGNNLVTSFSYVSLTMMDIKHIFSIFIINSYSVYKPGFYGLLFRIVDMYIFIVIVFLIYLD